ncbi:addiction module toxin RelE, partial [Avibacterium paragallinarum]
MRIISTAKLIAYYQKHPETEQPL